MSQQQEVYNKTFFELAQKLQTQVQELQTQVKELQAEVKELRSASEPSANLKSLINSSVEKLKTAIASSDYEEIVNLTNPWSVAFEREVWSKLSTYDQRRWEDKKKMRDDDFLSQLERQDVIKLQEKHSIELKRQQEEIEGLKRQLDVFTKQTENIWKTKRHPQMTPLQDELTERVEGIRQTLWELIAEKNYELIEDLVKDWDKDFKHAVWEGLPADAQALAKRLKTEYYAKKTADKTDLFPNYPKSASPFPSPVSAVKPVTNDDDDWGSVTVGVDYEAIDNFSLAA